MHKYVFPEVLPVTTSLGHAFFTVALMDTIAQEKFRNERIMCLVDQDVEYVSRLLLHSVSFGTENTFGVWGTTRLVYKSEIDDITKQVSDGQLDHRSARIAAEQLLLRFGFLGYQQILCPIEAARLKNCGGVLYMKAARANEGSPLGDQLKSMSGNFWPWIDILRDMRRRESLCING